MNVIRLNAGNDRNGNPRRVYVVVDGEGMVAAMDEGYEGDEAIFKHFPSLRGQEISSFLTTPAEYRRILREHRTRKHGARK